jgi:hypothetical protein
VGDGAKRRFSSLTPEEPHSWDLLLSVKNNKKRIVVHTLLYAPPELYRHRLDEEKKQ